MIRDELRRLAPRRLVVLGGERAVSASVVAAAQGGPLLLSAPTGVAVSVRGELARLAPPELTVLGGVKAVSWTVENELASYIVR